MEANAAAMLATFKASMDGCASSLSSCSPVADCRRRLKAQVTGLTTNGFHNAIQLQNETARLKDRLRKFEAALAALA